MKGKAGRFLGCFALRGRGKASPMKIFRYNNVVKEESWCLIVLVVFGQLPNWRY